MTCHQPYLLHALSPLHAGTGQAAELIDLPIARSKGTGIPFLPGSSIKGVLRDAAAGTQANVAAIFGPGVDDPAKFAGALTCSDARLLALPVRSFQGVFAYVTSPLLLMLAARDLAAAPDIPDLAPNHCMVDGDRLVVKGTGAAAGGEPAGPTRTIFLEDLDLIPAAPSAAFTAWRQRLAGAFGTEAAGPVFSSRFAVVDDETMAFLWETATQLDQRVRINPESRVVETGALWLEESLPPETLLIGLLASENSRGDGTALSAAGVMAEVERLFSAGGCLQFGGKSTVGRGRCLMRKL